LDLPSRRVLVEHVPGESTCIEHPEEREPAAKQPVASKKPEGAFGIRSEEHWHLKRQKLGNLHERNPEEHRRQRRDLGLGPSFDSDLRRVLPDSCSPVAAGEPLGRRIGHLLHTRVIEEGCQVSRVRLVVASQSFVSVR